MTLTRSTAPAEVPASATTGWQAALDGLAAHLHGARRFVDGLDADPPAPWSPPTLAPLPAGLAGRARQLLDELRVLEQAVRVRRELLHDEIAPPARRYAPVTSPAVMVDRLL